MIPWRGRRVLFPLILVLSVGAIFLAFVIKIRLDTRPKPDGSPTPNTLKQERLKFDDEIDDYYRMKAAGAKSQSKSTKEARLESENTKQIQGAMTGEAVLGTGTDSYVQYIALPGVSNFSSNQFNGTASLSYPIKLPPGPGGYTPSVALSYSSGSVDEHHHGQDTKVMSAYTRQSGPLGLGWGMGESSISIDTHGEKNPCYWTYRIVFPGGSGEMFKIDVNGNKLQKCQWQDTDNDGTEDDWVVTDAWKNTIEWRTSPEMFLEIQQGYASTLAPGDGSFAGETDIWKIGTPDGTLYYFGSGREKDGSVNFANLNVWAQNPDGTGARGCGRTRLSWKLFKSVNVFGQSISYSYTPVTDTSPAGWCDEPIIRSRLVRVSYGPNTVDFLYNQLRQDTGITSDGWDQFVNANGVSITRSNTYTPEDQVSVDSHALSEIVVYAGGQQFRRYRFSYFDTWVPDGGTHKVYTASNCWQLWYKVEGSYTINDGLSSYHLMLKTITEQVSPNNSLPPSSFTYQTIPLRFNACNELEAASELRNSLYIKRADNGFGGATEYTFEPERLSDLVYEANGATFKESAIADPKVNKSLKRARLKKITVRDGIGNYTEQVNDYGSAEPVTVLSSLVLGKKDTEDSDFVGYAAVNSYRGKKNLPLNPADAKTWTAMSRALYHQLVTAAGCSRKDPRSGMNFLSRAVDETGLIADTITYHRYRNGNVSDLWPDANGETCTDIPPRPLVFTLRSDTVSAGKGVALSQGTLVDGCKSTPAAAYCNNSTKTINTYQWNFASVNNPEQGSFGGLTNTETFVRRLQADGSLTSFKVGSSQTTYTHQGYGIGNTQIYFLNKPVESWVNNPDSADGKKYKWGKMYYDGRGLVTKTETLTADGTVVGMSEIVAYDQWGNVTQSKDGLGRVSSLEYDATFHAYALKTTNAMGHSSSTVYNYQLGVPLETVDPNGVIDKMEYDGFGRLVNLYRGYQSGDFPTATFAYQYNQTATYGVPLVVFATVYTAKTSPGREELNSADLYDGLGGKIQTQSLASGKVLTSWSDIDSYSRNLYGVKSYATETFVASANPADLGKLVKAPSGSLNPQGVKYSFVETTLSGTQTITTDINGNVSRTITNPSQASIHAIAPNGVVTLTSVDPVGKRQIATIGNTPIAADQFAALAGSGGQPPGERTTTTTLSDFLGNTIKVTDTLGKLLTDSVFDSLGRLKTTTDADRGQSEIVAYDLVGNVLETKDAVGTSVQTEYDPLNRPARILVNATQKTTFSYDASVDGKDCGFAKGKLCKKIEKDNFGNSITSYFTYDQLGRLMQESVVYGGDLSSRFGSGEYTTTYEYDLTDLLIAVTLPAISSPNASAVPAETVRYSYSGPYLKNVAGDQVYVSDIAYDDLGRVTSHTLGNGNAQTFVYDGNRRLSSIAVSGGVMDLSYTYDTASGNILGITDAVTYSNPQLSKTMSYEYDTYSRLTRAYNTTLGVDDTYQYDVLNNLIAKNEGGKSYSFTPSSNTTSAYHGLSAINGNTEVSYDGLGRMTSYTIPGEYKIQVNAFDVSSGKPQNISYTSLSGSGASATEHYYYDASGRRMMKALLSGTESEEVLYVNQYIEIDLAAHVVRKNYFAGGKLVAVREFDIVTTSDLFMSVSLEGIFDTSKYLRLEVCDAPDPNTDANCGEFTAQDLRKVGESFTITQVPPGRKRISLLPFYFDEQGNRLTEIAGAQIAIQHCQEPGSLPHECYQRFKAGESTYLSATITLPVVTFPPDYVPPDQHSLFGSSNDIFGLAIEWAKKSFLKINEYVSQLSRTPGVQQRTCDPTLPATHPQSCSYSYPNLQITILPSPTIAQTSTTGSGNTSAQSTGALNTTASASSPPRTFYLHTDHLGSVMAITDQSGNVVEQRSYAPYGKEAASAKATASQGNPTERGYTGQIKDSATSLSYFNARYYDPVLSRFISADTASDLQNPYSYVGGNPINASDPSGNIMTVGDGGGGGGRRSGSGGANQGSTPLINAPAPGISSTSVFGGTVGFGTPSNTYATYGQTGWENDVSDITTGFMQAGVGMLMGPAEAMSRDWDLFWNTPGGVLEKAFLAADFVMFGGLWGYGEWSAANPNASFGERLGPAVGPGIQIAAMIGPKVVPAVSRGIRMIGPKVVPAVSMGVGADSRIGAYFQNQGLHPHATFSGRYNSMLGRIKNWMSRYKSNRPITVVDTAGSSGKAIQSFAESHLPSDAKVINMDISEWVLSNNKGGLTQVGANAFKLPLASNSVDLLFQANIYDYYTGMQGAFESLFAEVGRVLKPGGMMIGGMDAMTEGFSLWSWIKP